LLNLEFGNVSRACKAIGLSRDTVIFRIRQDLLQAKAQDREHVRAAQDWRRIAIHYDRCAHTFFSAICIAATVIFYLN
jgi:hypothetical protein